MGESSRRSHSKESKLCEILVTYATLQENKRERFGRLSKKHLNRCKIESYIASEYNYPWKFSIFNLQNLLLLLLQTGLQR